MSIRSPPPKVSETMYALPRAPGSGPATCSSPVSSPTPWRFPPSCCSPRAVFQVEIFRGHANELAAGELTYADLTYEYPPVSLSILVLLRLLTSAAPKKAAYRV